MTNARFDALFGGPPRKPEAPLTQREMDLAASVQAVTEEIVLKLAHAVAQRDRRAEPLPRGRRRAQLRRQRQAAAAGLRSTRSGCSPPRATPAAPSARRWWPPTCTRASRARPNAARRRHAGARISGPPIAQDDIERRLEAAGAVFESLADDDADRSRPRGALADGKALGWLQGRMEFGPRALGGRSILGDARSPTMQKLLNLKVKYRESFRPFAPSVLREDVADWFDLDSDSPYMLLVADVAAKHRIAMTAEQKALFGIDQLNVPRSSIPAVTHVDYSARIQTVHRDTNPRYHALDQPLQGADRLPGHRQHQLQRARRAHRLHAGGRLPLLHGHRDRGAGRRQLLPAQGRPGSGAQATLRRRSSSSTDGVAELPRLSSRASGCALRRAACSACVVVLAAAEGIVRVRQWVEVRAPRRATRASTRSTRSIRLRVLVPGAGRQHRHQRARLSGARDRRAEAAAAAFASRFWAHRRPFAPRSAATGRLADTYSSSGSRPVSGHRSSTT